MNLHAESIHHTKAFTVRDKRMIRVLQVFKILQVLKVEKIKTYPFRDKILVENNINMILISVGMLYLKN